MADSNVHRPGLSSAPTCHPNNPPTRRQKSRDQLIYDYVEAAREKIHSGPSNRVDNSSSRSTPRASGERSRSRPPPGPMRSASQWPLPPTNREEQRPRVRTQNELAPYRERAPMRSRGPPPGTYDNYAGRAPPVDHRDRPRNRGPPPPNQYGPRPRGPPPPRGPPRGPPYQQQQQPYYAAGARPSPRQHQAPSPQSRSCGTSLESRYSTRGDDRRPREYAPASNIGSPEMSPVPTPAPQLAPPPRVPSPRSPATLAPPQSPIPTITEDDENRRSLQPSVSSVGASDVLSDYYRPDSAQDGEDEAETDMPRPSNVTEGQVEVVRHASMSQRQKPIMTTISRTNSMLPPEEEKPARSTDDTNRAEPPRLLNPEAALTLPTSMPDNSPQSDRPSLPRSPSQLSVNHAARLEAARSEVARLNAIRSSMQPPTIKSKTSNDSFMTARGPASPGPRPKSPFGFFSSRNRQSGAELDETPSDLEPPRAYFASAPSTSTVDLMKPQANSQAALNPGTEVATRGSRASMTSLSGLITRALRLATNLERGKTSSKFGIDWMVAGNKDDSERATDAEKRQSQMSLKTMLNAFPQTPETSRVDQGEMPLSHWPLGTVPRSALRRSQHMSLPSTPDGSTKRRRQCCFMPLWLFCIVVLLLVLIAVAAIVIPIMLIVVPNQQHGNAATQALAACMKSHTCAHGGASSITASNTCSCTCVNGWTGPTCTDQGATGCVSTNLSGSDTSVGSSVPRVITLSRSFGISLDASSLFTTFADLDISCSSQNALVTFNGLTARSLPLSLAPRATPAATTRNGIVFAPSWTGSVPAATGTEPANILYTPTATASGSSAVATFDPTSQQNLDFGRTAVLYVLEKTSDLDTAIDAQSALQTYFSAPSGKNASEIDLGSGWTADLVASMVVQG